jgi:hypothetical protein
MEFSIPNPMDGIPAARFQQAPVKAFVKAEVELMLKACAYMCILFGDPLIFRRTEYSVESSPTLYK